MSTWVKIRNKITSKLVKWFGLEDLAELFHGNHDYTENGGANPYSGHSGSEPATGDDEVAYKELDFCWGGFKGGSAKHVKESCIKNLKVRGDTLTYSWKSGGCENLGASSKTDAGATLACLFCCIDGKWKGGKFDWISTSRTSRNLENVFGGYNGWDKNATMKAAEFAFVIVSKDGGRRTNVVRTGKSRGWGIFRFLRG